MTTIKFYKVNEAYGAFSNFSAHPFEINGVVWPTSEHYFQAQKFLNNDIQEKIRSIISPMDAALMGRDRSYPLRLDWEEVKDDIMRQAVLAKFSQNKDIAQLLIDTGDKEIIEHTKNDHYWADGGDGTGKNMLGIILMEVREQLRKK